MRGIFGEGCAPAPTGEATQAATEVSRKPRRCMPAMVGHAPVTSQRRIQAPRVDSHSRQGEDCPAMKRSTDRILTTHVGSLSRPDALVSILTAKDRGQPFDGDAYARSVREAVADVVRR